MLTGSLWQVGQTGREVPRISVMRCNRHSNELMTHTLRLCKEELVRLRQDPELLVYRMGRFQGQGIERNQLTGKIPGSRRQDGMRPMPANAGFPNAKQPSDRPV